mmetsp:Transcript_125204/g.401058  ORF Transcript_125204/g.401058 Transcript_125204/m.401058 type:complete len:323 (+) Transcript_125204:590-1558(+)
MLSRHQEGDERVELRDDHPGPILHVVDQASPVLLLPILREVPDQGHLAERGGTSGVPLTPGLLGEHGPRLRVVVQRDAAPGAVARGIEDREQMRAQLSEQTLLRLNLRTFVPPEAVASVQGVLVRRQLPFLVVQGGERGQRGPSPVFRLEVQHLYHAARLLQHCTQPFGLHGLAERRPLRLRPRRRLARRQRRGADREPVGGAGHLADARLGKRLRQQVQVPKVVKAERFGVLPRRHDPGEHLATGSQGVHARGRLLRGTPGEAGGDEAEERDVEQREDQGQAPSLLVLAPGLFLADGPLQRPSEPQALVEQRPAAHPSCSC